MSLIVSLRIPDGVVIAGDSLSTTQARLDVVASMDCPKCKHKIKDVRVPTVPFPASTSSYAQKVMPLLKKFGVGTFGMSILNEKTIYYHVKNLEDFCKREKLKINDVNRAAEEIKKYFDLEIKKQIKDIASAPDNFYPLGFQVVGYKKEAGKTIEVKIGKHSMINQRIGLGCTVSGATEVVIKLWELNKQIPRYRVKYGSFSLQDAIDYAESLINITATQQRFSSIIPSVGGEVDIALITPYKDFTWIKSKKLTKILEERGKNEG